MRTSINVAAILLLSACGGEPPSATLFNLTFENVSSPGELVTSDGGAVDVIYAAGVWVKLASGGRLFSPGAPASSELEGIAEDGENLPFLVAAEDRDETLRAGTLAEVDVTTYDESPLRPGVKVEIELTAEPSEELSFVSMFVQSNDTFLAPREGTLPLFDADGRPMAGDRTSELALFDAGTEVNEEPGLGPNQAPRQAEHGDGMAEGGVVSVIEGTDAGGFTYPSVTDTFRLEVTVLR